MSKPYEFTLPSGMSVEVKTLEIGAFSHKTEEEISANIWDILGISEATYQ